jgi:hypothetical protein
MFKYFEDNEEKNVKYKKNLISRTEKGTGWSSY